MKGYLKVYSMILFAIVSLAARGHGAQADAPVSLSGTKVALVVITEAVGGHGTHRFFMATSYARQLKKAGADVHIFFDGPGAQWPAIADVQEERPAPEGSSETIKGWKAQASLIEKVQKDFKEMSALGVPLRVSGRAVDKMGLRAKFKGKTLTFTNESGTQAEIPRLMAQGYQILIF